MNRNQCYNCGGDLGKRDGRIVCLHCGTYMPEHISTEEAMLLAFACQKLRLADFSEAEQEFEDIVFRHPKCAQGYWGRLLAKYGIKYEEDYDGSRIPTCYAASIESVYDSSDYKKALEYADEENRAVFREHAAYIERVRLEWVEKASKEPPYDIFISYKDSDREHGIKRTQDSYTMQDLYFQLKEKGYRVFFSYESLRDKTGEKYEPYIYGALSTAKVMLVYGSKPEYINATWVKNEWTRYKKRMQAGEKKNGSLLVAYEGFTPAELPGALSSLQCLDAGEKRFYTDLFAAIERILEEDLSEEKLLAVSARTDEAEGEVCDHVPMVIPGKAPTCTKAGWTESSVCTLCGKTLRKLKSLPATGHSFGEWQTSKKATCTEDGMYERVCVCGEKETKRIPSRGGHVTSGEWETIKEPTAEVDGLKAKICIICGAHTEEEKIPVLPASKKEQQIELPVKEIPFPDLPIDQKTPSVDEKASLGLAYAPYADGKTCRITGIGACKDTHVVIPDEIDGYKVTRIGERAFRGCESITGVTVGRNVSAIGNGAFYGCVNLECAVIGLSVTSIVRNAFGNCAKLKNIRYLGSNIQWKRIMLAEGWNEGSPACKIWYEAPQKTIAQGLSYEVNPDGKTCKIKGIGYCESEHIIIPAMVGKYKVTDLGEDLCRKCIGIESVTLPDPLTNIDPGALTGVGEVWISKYHRFYVSIKGNLYTKDGKTILHYAVNKKEAVFSVPSAVRTIGKCAFSHARHLTEVIIPVSVKEIESRAFCDCVNLKRIRYEGTDAQWEQIKCALDWKDVTCVLEMKTSFAPKKPEPVCSQGLKYEQNDNRSTYTIKGIGSCRDTDLVIPESVGGGGKVTHIHEYAFWGYAPLRSVVISDTVTYIGKRSFAGYVNPTGSILKSVILGASVSYIGEDAFHGCRELKKVDIPASVTGIGDGAFAGTGEVNVSSGNLSYASISGQLYSKNFGRFMHCPASAVSFTFTFPSLIGIIAKYAFADCKNLTDVTVPASVESIEDLAFSGCENLRSLRYGGTKKQWKRIALGKDWRQNSAIRKINCIDGTIKFLFS